MRAVLAFEFETVNVSVLVPLTLIGSGEKLLEIEGGATTITVLVLVLFVSFSSSTLVSGSTVAVFTRLPEAVGVTAKVTLNEPPIGMVTNNPLAVQLSVVPVIAQLIVPTGAIPPFVTVNEPCG